MKPLKSYKVEKRDEKIAFSDSGNIIVGVIESPYKIFQKIVEDYGPGEVFISAFSLTELSVNALCDLSERGLITTMKAIIDYSNLNGKSNLCFQLEDIGSVKYAPVHAKLLSLKTIDNTYVITGSANLQVKNRIEIISLYSGSLSENINSQFLDIYDQL